MVGLKADGCARKLPSLKKAVFRSTRAFLLKSLTLEVSPRDSNTSVPDYSAPMSIVSTRTIQLLWFLPVAA